MTTVTSVNRDRNRTSVNGVPYKRIAEILRQARDLMNSGGRHWVKGTEKIDVAQVDPVSRYEEPHNGEVPTGEYAFCSIGAVAEVCGKGTAEYEAALWELAKVMDIYVLENAQESYEEQYVYSYMEDNGLDPYKIHPDIKIPKPNDDDLVGFIDLNTAVAEVNDSDYTKWEDIRDWFTTAAKRAMAKR